MKLTLEGHVTINIKRLLIVLAIVVVAILLYYIIASMVEAKCIKVFQDLGVSQWQGFRACVWHK